MVARRCRRRRKRAAVQTRSQRRPAHAHAHTHATVPTLRPELTGLRLLCLSDTHDFQSQMPGGPGGCDDLPHADILVHAGDFTMRGAGDEVGNFQRWVERLLSRGVVRHAVVVAGNHELSFQPERSKHAVVRQRQQVRPCALPSLLQLAASPPPRRRQRDRETERQRDRETERQRDRETERQRDRETETETRGKRQETRDRVG